MIDFRRLLAMLVDAKVEFVIVGGVAATLHGSARLTSDLDIVYGRSKENIGRTVAALIPLHPYLRGAPAGLPFHLDAETVRAGLNFTLTTDAGPLDLIGEIAGGFNFEVLRNRSTVVDLFGKRCRVISLDALIESKMAAGRPKDLEVIAELEAIREEQSG
jgi:predicted nucleotidyltransferase